MVALDTITLDPIDDMQLGSHPEALDAAISPDGASMAISTRDPPTVSIIDLTTGAIPTGQRAGGCSALAYSPDGSSLIGGDADSRVLRLRPRRRENIGEPVTRHDGFVVDIDVAADGTRFTSGSTDGNVGLWETATGRYVGTIQPGSPNTTVRSRWAADGHTSSSCTRTEPSTTSTPGHHRGSSTPATPPADNSSNKSGPSCSPIGPTSRPATEPPPPLGPVARGKHDPGQHRTVGRADHGGRVRTAPR